MIATDGDEAVLQRLSSNMERNAPRCQVTKLYWGNPEPLTRLGSPTKELDFVLATDVVFGDDMQQWVALVETIKAVSGTNTLVVIANLRHPNREAIDRAFYKPILEEFEVKQLPQSLLHPTFRRQNGSCPIQVLKRKGASS